MRARDRRGFIISFERGNRAICPTRFTAQSTKQFFDISQDHFVAKMHKVANLRREAWGCDKLKVVMATIFDDMRLTLEYESLFYHWWATNKHMMLGEFETIRA